MMSAPVRNTLVVILLACAVAILGWQTFAPNFDNQAQTTKVGADEREAVALNAEQIDFALTQMRGLLGNLARLDQAEFAREWESARDIAVEEGPGQKRDHPEGFHEALPQTFRSMSRQMRQGFGKAADSAGQQDWGAYAEAKAEIQSTCLTCHESYRFERRD